MSAETLVLNRHHNPFRGKLFFRACWGGSPRGSVVDQIDAGRRLARVRFDLFPGMYFDYLASQGKIELSLDEHVDLLKTIHRVEGKYESEAFEFPERPNTEIQLQGKTWHTKDMVLEIPYDAVLVYGAGLDLRECWSQLPKHWIRQSIHEMDLVPGVDEETMRFAPFFVPFRPHAPIPRLLGGGAREIVYPTTDKT